jgi:hypothetical protein
MPLLAANSVLACPPGVWPTITVLVGSSLRTVVAKSGGLWIVGGRAIATILPRTLCGSRVHLNDCPSAV